MQLSNVTEALRELDEDERGSEILNTLGGPQDMRLISEPGFYKLVARSRKPEAKIFDRWVRHDVLPAIRKTGSYVSGTHGLPDDPSPLHQLLDHTTKRIEQLEAQIESDKPKVAFYNDFASKEDI